MRPDARLAALSARQLNLVTWKQALACGLTPAQVKHLVKRGHLVRVHRSVYCLPGADPSSPTIAALAACLAAGPKAVASHFTAAALWGFIDQIGRVHVTVPVERRPRTANVAIHRTLVLRPADATMLGPVPVTTPPRTVLDVGALADGPTLERCLDNALTAAS